MIGLSVRIDGLDQLQRMPLFDDGRRQASLGRVIDHGRMPVMKMASGRIHSRTGRTVASAVSTFAGLGAIISFRGGGVFQERGTMPHAEFARGQAMVFSTPGGLVFTDSVHNPGTRATHWAEAGMDDAMPAVMVLAAAGLGEMLGE